MNLSQEQIQGMVFEHIKPMLQRMIDEALNERLPEVMALLKGEAAMEEQANDNKG